MAAQFVEIMQNYVFSENLEKKNIPGFGLSFTPRQKQHFGDTKWVNLKMQFLL